MKILTMRKNNLKIKNTIESEISNWYFDNGIVEPNWKFSKDPQWWIDYLNEVENEI